MKSASPSLFTYAVIYLIFLYAPILLLPIFAFNDSAIIALPLSGFTFDWFFLLWKTEALHPQLHPCACMCPRASRAVSVRLSRPGIAHGRRKRSEAARHEGRNGDMRRCTAEVKCVPLAKNPRREEMSRRA